MNPKENHQQRAEFEKKVRAELDTRGWLVKDLAKKVGVSIPTMYTVLRNKKLKKKSIIRGFAKRRIFEVLGVK